MKSILVIEPDQHLAEALKTYFHTIGVQAHVVRGIPLHHDEIKAVPKVLILGHSIMEHKETLAWIKFGQALGIQKIVIATTAPMGHALLSSLTVDRILYKPDILLGLEEYLNE